MLLLLARGDPAKLDPLHKNAYTAERGAAGGLGKVWLEAALCEVRNAARETQHNPTRARTD